jgi:hypothetical protein
METFWQAHFYRQAYGDVGYGPIPFLAREAEEAEGLLSEALLARYAAPKLRRKGAQTADLVDERGRVVLRLAVRDTDGTMRLSIPAASIGVEDVTVTNFGADRNATTVAAVGSPL